MILSRIEYLWLLPILGLVLFWEFRFRKRSGILFSDVRSLSQLRDRRAEWLTKVSRVLRYALLLVLVIALIQPKSVHNKRNQRAEGIDIIMVLDVSISMNAEDLKPNRLQVAKETIDKFVSNRVSDRIGVVVFGGDAFTLSPLTVDYTILREMLAKVNTGQFGNGTAIGLAIATGLNRLKSSDAKSKVMVLLTDGENNAGGIEPLAAAELAKKMGVKLYVVGVGQQGGARTPVFDDKLRKRYLRGQDGRYVRTQLDEVPLKEIARLTGGRFFRAEDEEGLKSVYAEIDNLEVSERDFVHYQQLKDLFPGLLVLALLLFCLELLCSSVLLVVVP